MKTEIVSGEVEPKGIDWCKPQLVKAEEGLIVATYGGHDKVSFSGTVICTTDESRWKTFEFSRNWAIRSFQPITEPITIKFIP